MKKVYLASAFFLLVLCSSAQTTGAQQVLQSIRTVTEFHSPLLQLLTEGRTPVMFTKEELAAKKIKTITECMDNSWAGMSRQRFCIKRTYDKYGNLTSAVKMDSAEKVLLTYTFTNTTDAKGNVTRAKISITPGARKMELTQQFNESGQIVSRKFTVEPPPPSPDEAPQEVKVDGSEKPEETYNYVENYVYDAKGRLIGYTAVHGFVRENVQLTWNEKGQLLTRTHETKTTVYYQEEIEGRPNQSIWRDSVQVLKSSWTYEYDPVDGNLVTIKESRSDFPLTGSITYLYDKAGHITEQKHVYSDAGHNSTEKHYFDAQGKKVKTELFGGELNALTSASVIEYDLLASLSMREKWTSFTNTGYTETVIVYTKDKMQKELYGYYVGHTTGEKKIYRNTFRTTWSYELYP